MRFRNIAVAVVNLVIFVGLGLALYDLASNRSTPTATEEENENIPGAGTQVRVDVGTITRATLHRVLTAYGRVEPAPTADVKIASPEIALVQEVACIEGQHVDQGQTLFTLDCRATDAEVHAMDIFAAACQAAREELKGDPTWAAALATWGLRASEAVRDRAMALEATRTFVAPFVGTVVLVNVHAGETTGPRITGVEIVDMDRLVVALDVPEFAAKDLSLNQTAWIEGAKSVQTSIVRIDPTIDPASGLVSVDVTAPKELGLKPGEFLPARIEVETHENCLAVPAESIVRDPTGRPRVAFVNANEHEAVFQPVELGIREGDLVEITGDSVTEGQEIVTEGAYGLANRTGIVVVGRR